MVGAMTIGVMMAGKREKRVYGDPLASLRSLLDNLRLKYIEHGKEKKIGISHIFEIPEFGILVHAAIEENNIQDTDVPGLLKLKYDTDADVFGAEKFGEELMWSLIERGYMAWIREHPQGGNERIFNRLVLANGWGQRILDKRMKDWEKRVDRRFLFSRLKKIAGAFSISEILSRFPGFFDFLS